MATGHACEDDPVDGDARVGTEVGQSFFGGVGRVFHADACHRDNDLLAAERAELATIVSPR
jgi:hypothetical protein